MNHLLSHVYRECYIQVVAQKHLCEKKFHVEPSLPGPRYEHLPDIGQLHGSACFLFSVKRLQPCLSGFRTSSYKAPIMFLKFGKDRYDSFSQNKKVAKWAKAQE